MSNGFVDVLGNRYVVTAPDGVSGRQWTSALESIEGEFSLVKLIMDELAIFRVLILALITCPHSLIAI
jgi:hypothetical protein